MGHITDLDSLRARYRAPKTRSLQKQMSRFERHSRRFIELSPFLVLATSESGGPADATPRGDQPGFVQVLDDVTLAIPDRPGNNRLDSLENILLNPMVALIFFVPGVEETLRVNGRAEIRDDPELLARFVVNGREPATVLVVEAHEIYLHCAKALLRSRLWEPDARSERLVLPSMGQMLRDQVNLEGPVESQEEMLDRYRSQLW